MASQCHTKPTYDTYELMPSVFRGYAHNHCITILQAACGPAESLADEERNCKYDFISYKSHRTPGEVTH